MPAARVGGTPITVRFSRDLIKRIARWTANQDSPVSRTEAIRRLTEFALEYAEISSKSGKFSQGAKRAAGMASDLIDLLGDQSATHEDREQRKRRLVKGPSEFRQMREKHDSARRKR